LRSGGIRLDKAIHQAIIEASSSVCLHPQISKLEMTRDGNARHLCTALESKIKMADLASVARRESRSKNRIDCMIDASRAALGGQLGRKPSIVEIELV
jgi:hypothetical protein